MDGARVNLQDHVGCQGSKIKNCLLLAACCLLVFVTGCITTSSDFESLRSSVADLQIDSINQKRDISQMKRDVSEMRKDISVIKSDSSNLSKDVSTLKEYSLSAMKESQSAILTRTTDLSKELQILKGRFDENKYFMDKSIKSLLSERDVQQAKIAGLENDIKELKSRVSSLAAEKKEGAAEKKEAAPVVPSQTMATAPAVPEVAKTDDPLRLYDDAHIALKEMKFAEARQKFERFTKDFPDHILTPNSYFWIGEAYYAEKKYEDAILSYEAFLKRYPQHDKTRGAMLKQAYAFIELGDRKTGKVILERVIEKYPKSNEAELAQKKIAEMLSKKNSVDKGSTKKKKK